MLLTFQDTASDFFNYAALMSNAHYDMAEGYRLRHRRLGTVVVCVTAISGAAAVVTLTKLVDPALEVWVKLAVGLLSLAATVLSALQTFLSFSDLQKQHKNAADGYSIARRSLQQLLTGFPDANGAPGIPGTRELDEIKKALDNLDKASPTVPDSVYDHANKNTPRLRVS